MARHVVADEAALLVSQRTAERGGALPGRDRLHRIRRRIEGMGSLGADPATSARSGNLERRVPDERHGPCFGPAPASGSTAIGSGSDRGTSSNGTISTDGCIFVTTVTARRTSEPGTATNVAGLEQSP